ncbi:Uncharacterized protein TCM_028713 [Theobroma cacao]|uniref:Uncharacterized protein n=1 Tax=Theobroma cacao TaxID=3641 RepID=A0A061GB06_THECC|nr:Uncharacterized protein TCM_028713 [Theobroma cacao]
MEVTILGHGHENGHEQLSNNSNEKSQKIVKKVNKEGQSRKDYVDPPPTLLVGMPQRLYGPSTNTTC